MNTRQVTKPARSMGPSDSVKMGLKYQRTTNNIASSPSLLVLAITRLSPRDDDRLGQRSNGRWYSSEGMVPALSQSQADPTNESCHLATLKMFELSHPYQCAVSRRTGTITERGDG
jgi:hypothetical protein